MSFVVQYKVYEWFVMFVLKQNDCKNPRKTHSFWHSQSR